MGRHPGLLLRDRGILSSTVTTVWTAITEGIGGFMQGIWDTITSIWNSIYETMPGSITDFRTNYWGHLAEKVTVDRTGRPVFTLSCGVEIEA